MKLDGIVRKWIRNNNPNREAEAEIPEETADDNFDLKIQGLNIEKGLTLYGEDAELYINALRSYAKNAPDVVDKIRVVTKDTLSEYVINIHGLKSVSATIGAEVAAKQAAHLERLAQSDDLEDVLFENENMIRDTDNLIAAIKDWLDKKDEM